MKNFLLLSNEIHKSVALTSDLGLSLRIDCNDDALKLDAQGQDAITSAALLLSDICNRLIDINTDLMPRKVWAA